MGSIENLLLKYYPTDEIPPENNFPRWIETEAHSLYGPLISTSLHRVHKALRLANCNAGDRVVDIGCGDGRFCTAAVKIFGAEFALGIDSDACAIATASEIADALAADTSIRLDRSRVSFTHGDVRDSNTRELIHESRISIAIAYLFPEFSVDLKDFLVNLYNTGCTIVAITFDLANIAELRLADGFDKAGEDGIWVYQQRL
ncbi:hypothetical protein HDU84_002082 [Entophlyctis sp. JEL0112]|nr:hypothetical protein HDU84_002082 [Entophlyctis sp. JEL0112]